MQQVLFGAGQTIFTEGDASSVTYRIAAGSVDIVVSDSDGMEHRIASLGPGEVFGEMGIIDPAPRSATAVAREDTACQAYTADEVLEMMTSDPEQAMALVKSLIMRLRSTNQKLVAKQPPAPPRRPVFS